MIQLDEILLKYAKNKYHPTQLPTGSYSIRSVETRSAKVSKPDIRYVKITNF